MPFGRAGMLACVPPPARGVDPELDRVIDWFESQDNLEEAFGMCVRTAIDEVIDTPRTGRWDLNYCANEEKNYVGVKLEHVVRARFDLAYGPRGMDYCVDGVDVDCKWSKNWCAWSIPREAAGHICLLVWASDDDCEIAVGLLRIREEILVGGNQDKKRSIQSPGGRSEIRWLLPRAQSLPPNFLLQLPDEDRTAILGHKGGDARARELFPRCEGVIIRRHTIESIGQQVDEARRFRGETRQEMRNLGFEVLNGHWIPDRARALELGGVVLTSSTEWVCLRADGSTPRRLEAKPQQLRLATMPGTGVTTNTPKRRARDRRKA